MKKRNKRRRTRLLPLLCAAALLSSGCAYDLKEREGLETAFDYEASGYVCPHELRYGGYYSSVAEQRLYPEQQFHRVWCRYYGGDPTCTCAPHYERHVIDHERDKKSGWVLAYNGRKYRRIVQYCATCGEEAGERYELMDADE